jgi:hypothetical protein
MHTRRLHACPNAFRPRFPLCSACLTDGSLPRATSAWQVGAAAPTRPLSLRSSCLADGSQPRATKRLSRKGGLPPPTPPLSVALGLPFRRLAAVGGETLESQVGASSRTPPLFAVLGLSCRRLATAGSERLSRRWGLPPPHPRFPLRSTCLEGGSILRTTSARQVGGAVSTLPLFAALGLSCKRLATAGNETFESQAGAAAPSPPLSAALGLSCRRLVAADNERDQAACWLSRLLDGRVKFLALVHV